ncbi:MAG TPA: alkaline phosphatase family protein [Pyrinomonadaceae bacterium]|nr:alkaline phosphatase family protein [Pyrinomonadaceae bacterium]
MTQRPRPSKPLAFSLILCFVLVLFTSPISSGQRRTQTPSSSPGLANRRARLVLMIVVDQFRYDYLERFGDLFAANGFRRLLRDGASWAQANCNYMPTYTAPGHATIFSGAWPSETGIVGNEWVDRPTGKKVTSVSDDSVRTLGGGTNEPGSSPRRLLTSTLGDELRLATNDRAKVIGISLKDRSAILPAGRHANAAYWFSTQTGNIVSSTYYFEQLPSWVTKFNNNRPADKYFGAKWERLLPESEYLKRAGPDAPPWENIGQGTNDTITFPHIITGGDQKPGPRFYGALDFSPFSNDLLVSFAEEALVNENLGQDEDTDILTVSFSANDYVGHRFGPYSQEVMDITLRVDRQVGSLLDFVDAKVGLANTLVLVTADHGVAPIPEHAAALGLGGGRIKSQDVIGPIRAAISAKYNPQHKSPDPTADYIYQYDEAGQKRDAFTNANLYFNYAALKRDGVSLNEIEDLAGQAALTVPGIARYFTRAQLLRGAVSTDDPIERKVLHGFYPARSGDLIILAEPYKYLGDFITATHGTPYYYDTNVPLIVVGAGIQQGRYYEAATPSDIAPTLAAMLGVTTPSGASGRVLLEARKK